MPPYDPPKGEKREKAVADLFQTFALAVQGNEFALQKLQQDAASYDALVQEARHMAELTQELGPGLWLLDAIKHPRRFDFSEFTRIMAGKGALVTVTRKADGPIAAKHGGIQYSCAVVEKAKDRINLTMLMPPGEVSNPENGILSNVPFLFHCNEIWWEKLRENLASLIHPLEVK